MRDSLTGNNYVDFKQRYEGTYGFLVHKNKKLLVYLRRVDNVRCTFTDETGTDLYANVDSGIEFEFIPCKRGVHNIKDDVVCISRVAATQYKRGVSKGNTSITSVSSYRTLPLDFNIMQDVFNSKYDVVKRYEQWKKDKSIPVALNTHFCLSGDSVRFYDQNIGYMDGDVFMVNPLVYQEFSDCLSRLNIVAEVKTYG